jgi:hypothetical protein
MLTYLVAASEGRHPLPEAAVATMGSSPRWLTHQPESTLVWTSPDGRVGFTGWWTRPEVMSWEPWHLGPDGLTAMAGWGWPEQGGWPAPDQPWAPQFAAHLATGAGLGELTGSFSAVRLDTDGRGWVGADPFGTGLVYTAPAEGFVAVSNNPAVAAGAAQRTSGPVRSSDSLAWLPFFAMVLDPATSLDRVEVLGPGARVEVGGDGWRRTPDMPLWGGLEPVGPDSFDRLAELLVAQMKTIARFPVRRRVLSLSGGKDSRLVAAAASAAGVLDSMVVRTHHSPGGSPDEAVAAMVGEVLGVEVKKVKRPVAHLGPGQFERRLRRHVFQTWGMQGAWDLKGNIPTSANLGVGGLFGETLRSHYAADRRFDGANDAHRFFAVEMAFDRAGILRAEVASELRARVAQWVERRLGEGVLPGDLADVHYAEHRLRRWLGTVRYVVAHNPVADPLQLPAGFRTALAAGHEVRRVDAIHFELIRRLCEPLARVPLAGKGWHPAARAMAPDPDRYDVPPVTGGGGGGHRWQDRRFPTLAPVFAAELLNDRGNPLLELLDRQRVDEVLSGRRRLDSYGKTALWATLAAAVWIDGGELPIRYKRHPSPTPGTVENR